MSGVETEAAEKLLAKYTVTAIPPPSEGKSLPVDRRQTVLVTGTTGYLGAYLLNLLELCDAVAKVVCLNRAADGGQQKQEYVCSAQGLNTTFTKAKFIYANLARPFLGLERSRYDDLLGEVDRIVHNAWSLNLHLPVEAFELQIQGVRRLMDFASLASKKVPITFVSSAGTLVRWSGPRPAPESHLTDLTLAFNGYSQAKMAASILLYQATQLLGIPTRIVRVGQICDRLNGQGIWNRQDWLPRIIASSLFLGILPNSLGPGDEINWILVEIAARAILDIAGIMTTVPTTTTCSYYNLVNPSISH